MHESIQPKKLYKITLKIKKFLFQRTEYGDVTWWVDGVASVIVSCLGLILSFLLIPILVSGRDFKRLITFLLIMETISVFCSLAEAIRVKPV